MVTAFHRLAVWPHMRVSDDNAGHEEPLVAALYNNTFQVVCFPSTTARLPLRVASLTSTMEQPATKSLHSSQQNLSISTDLCMRSLLLQGFFYANFSALIVLVESSILRWCNNGNSHACTQASALSHPGRLRHWFIRQEPIPLMGHAEIKLAVCVCMS